MKCPYDNCGLEMPLLSGYMPAEIPEYQAELIKHLAKFKYTAPMRQLLLSMKFGQIECDQIRKMADENFVLKQDEAKVLL